MKNEKFCFSKGTGLIALVGVLLVGFVLLTQMANTQTGSNAKAGGPTDTKVINGVLYSRSAAGCSMSAKCNYLMDSQYLGYAYKCVSVGSCVGKDTSTGLNVDLYCTSAPSSTYATNGLYDYTLGSAPTGISCAVNPAVVSGDPKCTDVEGGKGNWYRTSSYATCAALAAAANTGYAEKTPISDSQTGMICCKATLQPTLPPADLTQAAKISAMSKSMCFRPSVGADCDAVSAKMKQPMVAILSSDAVYKNDCGTTAPLACKAVKNLCDSSAYFKNSGGTMYKVTGTYPNTFVVKSGVVWCNVATVATAPTTPVNTNDTKICAKMNTAGFHLTTDGSTDLGAVTATRDADGFCTL